MHKHRNPRPSPTTQQEQLTLNRRGLICGPDEGEEEFLKRVSAATPKGHAFPEWKLAEERLIHLFDCAPDWVAVDASSKGLLFWEGAAMEVDDSGSVLISLKKSALLERFYPQEELLAHEAAHAARAAFQEERFEEHFAFLTSAKPWRRFFGPLFRGAHEVRRLGICTLLSLGGATLTPFWNGAELLLLAPFVALIYLLSRLVCEKWTLRCAKKRVLPFLKNPAQLLPFLFRLSDEEIALFAAGEDQAIKEYVALQCCPRWNTIKTHYCHENSNL